MDVLHHESKEWLETIAFWKEEMQFFHKLLHLQDPLNKSDQIYRGLLDDLEKIKSSIFTELQADVIEHERMLSKLERNEKGLSDSDYRELHSNILEKMETMTGYFKKFKKVVFGFVKDLRS